jgi:hypothetical protein
LAEKRCFLRKSNVFLHLRIPVEDKKLLDTCEGLPLSAKSLLFGKSLYLYIWR